MATWQHNNSPGFTLVEVLVAMTIVAVSLLAALRVATQGTHHVGELQARMFAGWVAADRLAEHHARGDWLPVGVLTGAQRQGNLELGWREEVSSTPNAAFRRVDIFVFEPAQASHFLAHSVGFVVNPSESRR
ncbi:type II secretion system protein GspI [Rhodanobacter sp. Soil772]|jgi:general secretion pathway protein I|uniref:type II secretion system minor pseudopilin GspI n=1 Tax=Rhodanobacter sp. Soil772 TaxID=1736406 RepID=UPI0006F38DB6|nr:type II secretion system minor pseudopilin GspI [Rhodanobacter sp. Soil772]KRE86931.1 type II secretion system protein GspI [Rhodanobacter sp. Soil772]